jgi:diguanylate cyclase (GGDEF)-like protein
VKKLPSSNKPRYLRTLVAPIVIVCALAVVITYLADHFIDRAINVTVLKDAEERAHIWAEEVTARTPELVQMANGVMVELALLEGISASADVNKIFCFKLFAADGRLLVVSDGRLLVVSDEPLYMDEGGEADDSKIARRVFATGISDVSIHDGTEKPNRPDTYVEIYIVAKGPDGSNFGVIKVFVDASYLSHALHDIFHNLGRLLIVGLAIVYLVPALVLIFRSEQLHTRDRDLLQLSLYDPLTETFNRRAFTSRAEALFDERENQDIGIMFFDLDRFKEINDDFGHEFGDRVLGYVARVLRRSLGPSDIIGRLGGDEFIILSPGANHSWFDLTAAQIFSALATPFTCNGNTVALSISIGAHLSPLGEDVDQAKHAADLALYRAKANGRGQLAKYSAELDDALSRRRHVEVCMQRSLDGYGGLFIEFQPIFHSCGHRIAGFEALLRLRDPDGGLIPPVEFIPIAEASGLINQIGYKSLEYTLEAAKDWVGDHFVAVNLSAIQFKNGKLVENVEFLLEKTGFDPTRLELEVTEGLLLEDDEQVSKQLRDLKNLGASISLDDFGTGYSSLGYLWKFQFDKLKIDRVFLEGFDFHSEQYRQVIATIVTLGHNLGLTVTVEGVETEAQLTMLKQLGCDQYQGFLLGRPMSVEAAYDIITHTTVEPKLA